MSHKRILHFNFSTKNEKSKTFQLYPPPASSAKVFHFHYSLFSTSAAHVCFYKTFAFNKTKLQLFPFPASSALATTKIFTFTLFPLFLCLISLSLFNKDCSTKQNTFSSLPLLLRRPWQHERSGQAAED